MTTKKDIMNHFEKVLKPAYMSGSFGGKDIEIVWCYKSWPLPKLREAYKKNLIAMELIKD